MHTLPEMVGIKNVRVPVAPFTMAHGGPQITSAPPRHGEHSVEILRELGYSTLDIDRMQKTHVI
jgi:crotonobetainyl-CoA:carnitine CoA-transferase CaiB-like acyl-CoA transferase